MALSIVGIDDLGLGHYAGKLVQEGLIREGDTPWSILRATQLHEFAGPEANHIVDLARRVSSHRHLRRRVVGIPVPGAAGKAMRSGALRPITTGATGALTFEEWLARGDVT